MADSCCTCATLLTDVKVPYDTASEKPLLHHRRLECCSRQICATCLYQNPRFQSYCPFCQISSGPSALPKDGLRLPPSYTRTSTSTRTPHAQSTSSHRGESPPPSYDDATTSVTSRGQRPAPEQQQQQQSTAAPPRHTEDTLHFVGSQDSLASLSLAYHVPVSTLRQHNNLYSDQLLAARKWILIPKSHYTGPSLSTPPDPEEEERKTKLRRWMIATKCPDYSVAALYLKGSDYNLDLAVDAFRADEDWEKSHPLHGTGKDKDTDRRRRGFGTGSGSGGSLSAQMS